MRPCSTDHFRCEPCAPVSRRPFCKGCGLFMAVNGQHRPDCTNPTTERLT